MSDTRRQRRHTERQNPAFLIGPGAASHKSTRREPTYSSSLNLVGLRRSSFFLVKSPISLFEFDNFLLQPLYPVIGGVGPHSVQLRCGASHSLISWRATSAFDFKPEEALR